MRRCVFVLAALCAARFAITSSEAADMLHLYAKSQGSKMRIEGTSTAHDWQVESKIVGGFMEVGPSFPTEEGQAVKPGKVEAHAEAWIPVRSLLSVEKNGTHYSDTMDETMWKNLKAAEYQKIVYRCTELELKAAPKDKDSPYVFDSKGQLAIAGVTNEVSMPVNVLPLGEKKLKISGSLATKMSAFKIPAEKIGLGFVSFKTADDVKLIFEWTVGPAKAPAAASASK